MEFRVGHHILLKVTPQKGLIIFGKRGKLKPRYFRPFETFARVGSAAYKLKLRQELSKVHDTFHMCNLKRRLADKNLVFPLDEIQVNTKLHFIKEPVEIMDREIKDSSKIAFL